MQNTHNRCTDSSCTLQAVVWSAVMAQYINFKDSFVATVSCIILSVGTYKYCTCYAGELILYVGAYEKD